MQFDTVIISGGEVQSDFALALFQGWGGTVIAADRGAEACRQLGIVPDLLVGDFDSISAQALAWVKGENPQEVVTLPTHKDVTDTQAALELALERGAKGIVILGGTGSRLDHVLANVGLLLLAREAGAKAWLMDQSNRISLAYDGMGLKKEEAFGTYVSFFPLSGVVKGLTLTGFAYPLAGKDLTPYDAGLTVSNELAGEEGRVSFSDGDLLMVESRDV